MNAHLISPLAAPSRNLSSLAVLWDGMRSFAKRVTTVAAAALAVLAGFLLLPPPFNLIAVCLLGLVSFAKAQSTRSQSSLPWSFSRLLRPNAQVSRLNPPPILISNISLPPSAPPLSAIHTAAFSGGSGTTSHGALPPPSPHRAAPAHRHHLSHAAPFSGGSGAASNGALPPPPGHRAAPAHRHHLSLAAPPSGGSGAASRDLLRPSSSPVEGAAPSSGQQSRNSGRGPQPPRRQTTPLYGSGATSRSTS